MSHECGTNPHQNGYDYRDMDDDADYTPDPEFHAKLDAIRNTPWYANIVKRALGNRVTGSVKHKPPFPGVPDPIDAEPDEYPDWVLDAIAVSDDLVRAGGRGVLPIRAEPDPHPLAQPNWSLPQSQWGTAATRVYDPNHPFASSTRSVGEGITNTITLSRIAAVWTGDDPGTNPLAHGGSITLTPIPGTTLGAAPSVIRVRHVHPHRHATAPGHPDYPAFRAFAHAHAHEHLGYPQGTAEQHAADLVAHGHAHTPSDP